MARYISKLPHLEACEYEKIRTHALVAQGVITKGSSRLSVVPAARLTSSAPSRSRIFYPQGNIESFNATLGNTRF